MRLQGYLTEEIGINQEIENSEKIIKILKRDCKPFLNEIKTARYLLYRGINPQYIPDTYKSRVARTNRKPRSVDIELHKEMGKRAIELFGWNTREEGVFTSKDTNVADEWGDPVIIIPIGNFKYVWMENTSFLYSKYDEYYVNPIVWEVYIWREMENYKQDNLNKYLSTPIKSFASECILKCKKYYIINYRFNDVILREFAKPVTKRKEKKGLLKRLFGKK